MHVTFLRFLAQFMYHEVSPGVGADQQTTILAGLTAVKNVRALRGRSRVPAAARFFVMCWRWPSLVVMIDERLCEKSVAGMVVDPPTEMPAKRAGTKRQAPAAEGAGDARAAPEPAAKRGRHAKRDGDDASGDNDDPSAERGRNWHNKGLSWNANDTALLARAGAVARGRSACRLSHVCAAVRTHTELSKNCFMASEDDGMVAWLMACEWSLSAAVRGNSHEACFGSVQ